MRDNLRKILVKRISSTFLFIGRPQAWDASDTTPTPSNSIGEMVNAYTDMIAMKKITSSDVSHALVRRIGQQEQRMTNMHMTIVQQIRLLLLVQITCMTQGTS